MNKIVENKPPAAGRGRPKGAENKVTRAVKDAVQAAFDEVGGADYLVQVAREDHKTFCALLGKVIPTQVNASLSGKVDVQFNTIIEQLTKDDGNTDR